MCCDGFDSQNLTSFATFLIEIYCVAFFLVALYIYATVRVRIPRPTKDFNEKNVFTN